jgi:hypothetical protein
MSEGTITCPKCGHENPTGTMNCEKCRVNLTWAFQHQDELAGRERQAEAQIVGERRVNIKQSNVICWWGVLAEGQARREKRFFELVKQRLNEHGWPYPLRFVDVGGGFFSSGQPYIETKAGKLVAFIGTESIGKDAYLSWSLTLAEPGIFQKAMAAAGNFSAVVFQEMTFNETNSARAFASSLNLCVQEAVDIIMDEAGLDKTKYPREASGLLSRLS